jgi:hypothetical protein
MTSGSRGERSEIDDATIAQELPEALFAYPTTGSDSEA